jgi:hypothetical protein
VSVANTHAVWTPAAPWRWSRQQFPTRLPLNWIRSVRTTLTGGAGWALLGHRLQCAAVNLAGGTDGRARQLHALSAESGEVT